MTMDFEYYTVSFDGENYWKHTTVATMDVTCQISFETLEPEPISWPELNSIVDDWIDEYQSDQS